MRNDLSSAACVDAALASFFTPRIKPGERLCAGLSGGMDSVVLLHAMRRLSGVSVSAVHVHHGLGRHADDWADFCRALCARLDVPLAVVRVDVPRGSGEGLEGAARRMRHAVFAGVEADWLVLAHHRDDLAETVLLNLLRGSGLHGAAGMPAERAQPRGPTLVRPLLGVERAAIARYAEAHGLKWVDDESNADTRFRRNFLRHEILPRLEREFPGARAALARAAGHFTEASARLDELAERDRAEVSSAASGRVLVAAFNRLGPARAAHLLRHLWVRAGFRAPEAAWVGEALKQLTTANALSEIRVTTAEGELRVYRGELYFVPPCEAPPAGPIPWLGQKALPWAGGVLRFVERVGEGLRRGALTGKRVWIAARQGGERLQPDARRPRRRLRHLLQEHAVPPWERERLPLLWVEGRLAWAGGLGGDAAFACAPGEEGLLPSWEGGPPRET